MLLGIVVTLANMMAGAVPVGIGLAIIACLICNKLGDKSEKK